MKEELLRQSWHFFLGSFFILIIALFPINVSLIIIGIIYLLGFFKVILIKKNIIKIKFIENILKKVTRKNEDIGKGALTLTLGFFLTLFFFPHKIIALFALTILTFGDGTSTIVGKLIGKHYLIKPRTLEGSIGGIIAAVIPLLILGLVPWKAVLISTIGMLSEYIPFEDNLSIPLISALLLSLIF